MSDECMFTQADEGMCSSHYLPAALCTHAAAALQEKVAYLEGQVKDDGATIAHLATRVRELEGHQNALSIVNGTLANRLSHAEATVGRMRRALEAITRRVPTMSSTGYYRIGQEDALESCSRVAKAALTEA